MYNSASVYFCFKIINFLKVLFKYYYIIQDKEKMKVNKYIIAKKIIKNKAVNILKLVKSIY
ncbi:hypothetical protein CBU02nite_02030 [Clostridium butyricum]|uniref:Uncharacterized protein n=1 Tax=Clostridium butyricum TaxID=1492 RepID=A0A512THI0_CLOBU|nr:hypothetical protein CBU02nite_02030 [Clostridium butyricum]